MNELATGALGTCIILAALVLATVWILFPFLVLSRLSKQQRILEEQQRNLVEIAKHTKSQADFWRNRNVHIE